jgi:hypothetical protein
VRHIFVRFFADVYKIDVYVYILFNTRSPYLRSLCPESSMKLVSLFQRLSRPHWLFEQPYRYRNAFLLLEIFDNIIQYQYTVWEVIFVYKKLLLFKH